MVHVGELERAAPGGRGGALARRLGAAGLRLRPTCAFLIAAAPAFIEGVFGPKFLDAVPLFRVSTLAVLFGCSRSTACSGPGRDRAILLSYMVALIPPSRWCSSWSGCSG